MRKNYSPEAIAFFAALFTFILVFLINFIVFAKPLYSAIVGSIVFVFVYAIVFYYITQILDKKINTIYKLINQTKAGKREQFYNENLLPRVSLQDVTIDVEDWAIKNKEAFELLEKNEQYRKEFLQNLSHELKTPLFAIQGYVESLQNGALYDETVNKKFLQNASNNIERLTDLLKDLDEITKLESENKSLEISTFSLEDLFENLCTDFANSAKQKNVHLYIKDTSLKNRKVIADKRKINQVLINLIENAIKYSKENGTISLNIDELNNKTIIVEISDDGIGIAEEQLDRIFERFYRTDAARHRKIGGSGLGLAICKHIIEAHQQTIHVRSKISVGTTFRFTLLKA
jgi:two-component system phosphate regulon sensor histidine kinase PhoR